MRLLIILLAFFVICFGLIGCTNARIFSENWKYGLTVDQISELKKACMSFDRNQDSYISIEELGFAMRSYGQRPTDTELKDIINELDQNGDEALNFSEIVALMSKKMHGVNGEYNSRYIYSTFDINNNGLISSIELLDVFIYFCGLLAEENKFDKCVCK